MNIKTFSDAMSELDSKYIDEALNYKKKIKRPGWIKWGAVAACAALAVFMAVRLIPQTRNGLPMLKLPDIGNRGMGFEGWLGYDITEWDNGNPWSEDMNLSTLPVYQNGAYHTTVIPAGLSRNDMMQRLENAASALNLDSYELETEQEVLTATSSELNIAVYANGMTEVWFTNGLPLPDGYSFTFYDTTDAQAEQALSYLSKEYAQLIPFKQPKHVLSGSYVMWNDYDENGKYITEPRFERSYSLYDFSENAQETILNYNFHYVRFYPDDDGNLYLIRIYDGLSCAKKIGDYPIISTEDAYELLLNGNYITSVPYAITDNELVCKVELVYRNSDQEKIFLPYYRFYVELPEMRRENGPTDYGAYYVPAVQSEYILNMPLWDGSIN